MKTMRVAGVLCAAALLAACPPAEETTPDAGGTVEATFTSLYGDYFAECKQCHAPGAPGRTAGIETTLDFSTKATAYTTIKTGMAAGLTGNKADCNGVPFLAATPAKSLILAVLDQPTRQTIDLSPQHANCDVDTITDATVKAGNKQPSAAFVSALKMWITAGAPNN